MGRVLYNKRKTINIIDNENSTSKGDPDFDFDYLLSNKPLDDSSFASFLHSNYLQFFQDIDEIQMASHYFSLSDVFSPLSFVNSIFSKIKHNIILSFFLGIFFFMPLYI